MSLPLPPDPYKVLGVLKDAKLPEIRSAHRKLVLKCHPDKVQDAALKAVKQDEFQQVQQAYELLSDDSRRTQYDQQVKLASLRKEMGKEMPVPRSSPADFHVYNAEPRTNPATTRPRPSTTYTSPQPSPRTFERPRSYEEVYTEPPRHTTRASKSQEYERERTRAAREDDEKKLRRDRREAEERAREKLEKLEKEFKRAEKSKKRDKERDRDRKRSSDEKHGPKVTATYVMEESDEDPAYYAAKPRSSEKMRQMMQEEIKRKADEAARAEKIRKDQDSTTKKMNEAKDYAAHYMQAAKRKVKPAPVEEDYEPRRPLQRAETYSPPSAHQSYNIKYAAPPIVPIYSDEDVPRRSSARSSSRKPSETTTKSRETKPSKESKRSASVSREPYVVAPSPPPALKKPTLKTHSSEPPILPSRKEPSRSKTMQPTYVRKEAIPPLPRASTFQAGDRGRGSKLRQANNLSSDESDSDTPVYASAKTHSPSPPKYRHAAPEPVRYTISNGRSVPVAPRGHRSESREDTYAVTRDRSVSPPHVRPSLTRATASRQAPRSSSHTQTYYPPDPPKTTTIPERPRMPARESQDSYRSVKVSPGVFKDIQYAPAYGSEHVVYSSHGTDQYRRASESNRGYDNIRPERVYA